MQSGRCHDGHPQVVNQHVSVGGRDGAVGVQKVGDGRSDGCGAGICACVGNADAQVGVRSHAIYGKCRFSHEHLSYELLLGRQQFPEFPHRPAI